MEQELEKKTWKLFVKDLQLVNYKRLKIFKQYQLLDFVVKL